MVTICASSSYFVSLSSQVPLLVRPSIFCPIFASSILGIIFRNDYHVFFLLRIHIYDIAIYNQYLRKFKYPCDACDVIDSYITTVKFNLPFLLQALVDFNVSALPTNWGGGGGGYVYWWPGSIICEDVYRLSDWIVYTWDRYVKYKWHPKNA